MLTPTTAQMLLSKIEAAHKARDTEALDSLFVNAYSLCGQGTDHLSIGFDFLASKLDIANKEGDHARFGALFELGLKWATTTDADRAAVWQELFLLGNEKVKP